MFLALLRALPLTRGFKKASSSYVRAILPEFCAILRNYTTAISVSLVVFAFEKRRGLCYSKSLDKRARSIGIIAEALLRLPKRIFGRQDK